jgi:hypothetical protein
MTADRHALALATNMERRRDFEGAAGERVDVSRSAAK